MLVKLIFDELLGKSVLNNLKGVYTFQATKGKPVRYMYNSSEQFKINMRNVARFLSFFCPAEGMLVIVTLMTNVVIQGDTTVKTLITQSVRAFTDLKRIKCGH